MPAHLTLDPPLPFNGKCSELIAGCLYQGSFPPPCGPESVCSLLDEDALLKCCKDGGLPEQGTPLRYLVLDGATIVGLLEQPLGNDQGKTRDLILGSFIITFVVLTTLNTVYSVSYTL